MNYSARIILDSVGPNGARLTTFELVMPRIVLAEFNTHRMFSRNSASSRAIPVEKMLARVEDHPFVPRYWGKNQKGMQADEELSFGEQLRARDAWLGACGQALKSAHQLKTIGVHKQITNRLLEPFMWHTVVFTATELSNFIALRNNKMAAPEIEEPSRMLVEAFEASKPMQLQAGEWHLPFVTFNEIRLCNSKLVTDTGTSIDWLYWAKISAARCARTSYLTHEGKRDIAEDVALYEKLVTSGHMSPLEHPAKALTKAEWDWNARNSGIAWAERGIPVGNFWGWEQFRKTIRNEHDFSAMREMHK